jgi:glycosyltransferase involved in cell wall biosynthesis
MAAILLSKTFHIPCVCHARGSDVNVYPYESRANFVLTRYVIENCDVPVATSKALAEKMSSMSRVKRQIRVLYKSVDTKLFSPAEDKAVLRKQLYITPDAFLAIFVGSLTDDKGIMELIEAWKEVSKRVPEALLVIIGSGPLHDDLVRVGQSVDVCGTKPNTEVALWMKASDVLVLPSHNEGLPNVVLEAMACGLPVVATSVGGIPEAVVQGETGFLVPPKDHQELAARILALAQNPDLRRSMGIAARRRIETVFRWENYVSGVMQVYRSAIERHKSRTRQRTPAER